MIWYTDPYIHIFYFVYRIVAFICTVCLSVSAACVLVPDAVQRLCI